MKLGVIAGAGALPVILTQEAKHAGRQVSVISITRDVDERLNSLATEFYQIGAGQFKKILDTLVKTGVEEIVVIGGVSKNLLFKPMHLDIRAIKVLSKLRNKSDPSIFGAIAEEIESTGIKLVDQRLYLDAPLDREWRSDLQELGFVARRPFTRMYRGDAATVGLREPLYAIVGPEFG